MKEILVSLGLMLGCGILVLAFQFMSGKPAAIAGSISQPESFAVVNSSTSIPSKSIAMDSKENQITNEEDTIAKIKEIFKEELDGHPLISNKSHWRQFPHVTNERWYHDNIVLLGDAKATAHYSIGSGTKLAMDSAIGLFDAVMANPKDVQAAFEQYDKTRRNTVEMIHQKLEFDSILLDRYFFISTKLL